MITYRNAPFFAMNLFIYITTLLTSLTTSTETLNKSPSKLLSLSNDNPLDTIHYYNSYYYEFPMNDYDDINTINILPNTITISTHLNESLFNLDIKDLGLNLERLLLSYDMPNNWNEIYENNFEYISPIRRRLGYRNVAKYKGRYVADGISRRFKDAKNYCRHIYGDLASIQSKDEEEQVKDLCAMWNMGNCWIGYEKPWGHWSDGRRPTYLHWKAGEPNNYGGREGCAEISSSGLWNDVKCRASRLAICERPRIHVVGHYVSVMRSMNWRDANKRCQELFSTDLATIENARENIMVRRACSALDEKGDCWIGLKRPFKTWIDGIDAKIKNFADDEPNNAGGNENCVAIMSTQRWKDSPCAEGHYFVCNTITQDVRVKKRAEAKRRRQEKEKELEKKRKEMEDKIMDQYMQQNQGSMMQNMMGGQGQTHNQGGMQFQTFGSNPYGQQQQQQGQGQQRNGYGGGFGQMSGFGQRGYGNGLDNGGAGANMQPGQMKSIFGDLGGGATGNAFGQWQPGTPFQINLGLGNGGNNGQQSGYNSGFGGFGFRRRMQMDIHENEWNINEIYGSKCKILGMNEICIGHNYIQIKKYIKSKPKQINNNRKFETYNNISNNNTEFDGDFMRYKLWKYGGNNDQYNDYVQYILSKTFIFNINNKNEQCFEYYNGYKLCMFNNGIFNINNNKNIFEYMNDNNWDYIENIYNNNNIFGNNISNKCIYVYSGDISTKICVQKTENKNDELVLYKAVVQFLAVSGHKENLNYQI